MPTFNAHQNTASCANHLINRYQGQRQPEVSPDTIRVAVRAWAASIKNQDVVTGLIVEEWGRQGGCELDFPDELSLQRQKLKEMSEGIVAMFRFDPELAGPLMAMVTSMLGVM